MVTSSEPETLMTVDFVFVAGRKDDSANVSKNVDTVRPRVVPYKVLKATCQC